MLSINNVIVYTDIYNVKTLDPGHPVYRLDGWGDDKGNLDSIVIKMETMSSAKATANDRRNVRVANHLMSLVDPAAKSIVLTRQELEQLKMYVSGGAVADQAGLAASNALKTDLNNAQGVWFKMPLKSLKKLDTAVDKRLQGDKADVRIIAAALKKTGGLEHLGKIIAVDMFNGNNDRFAYPHRGDQFPGLPARFKRIGNLGNVMIALGANGTGRPIGLDNYDPANAFKDLTIAVDRYMWAGMLLHKDWSTERKKFVQDIISDLEMALGPRNRKIALASTNRLGTNRTDRVLKGMLEGKNMVQRALVPLKARPGTPIGITNRLTLLGW